MPLLNREQLLTLVSNLKIDGKHSCWIFRRKPNWHGYGQVGNKNGGTQVAHRAFYEYLKGKLKKNILLHHICENKMCVNPFHLKPLTQREHGILHRPKVCKRGHPLTKDNVYKNWKQRYCKMCHRFRYEKYRLKQRKEKILLGGGMLNRVVYKLESNNDGAEV